MNSLRSSQLSAMLFLSAAFTILCQTASWTMEGIFGTGIAVAVQFLLCVPIFLLYRQGFSLSDGDVKHRLLSTLLLGYLLVRGGGLRRWQASRRGRWCWRIAGGAAAGRGILRQTR